MRFASRSAAFHRSLGRRCTRLSTGPLLVVGLALGWCAAPRVARACSCIAPPAPEEAFENADAVFEARPFGMSADDRQARYRFEVDRVWKGPIGPQVEIITARHSATCGRTYQVGAKYVVYAQRDQDGEWSDNLCSRTRGSRSAAEDLEVLGAGRPPDDDDREPTEPQPDPAAPAEPPRIDAEPVQPPPTTPSSRGCAMEKPHTELGLAWLMLLGLGVAAGRRRAVGSSDGPLGRSPGSSPRA